MLKPININISFVLLLLLSLHQSTFSQSTGSLSPAFSTENKQKFECENEITNKLESFLLIQADVILRKSSSFEHIREMKKYLLEIREKVTKLEEVFHIVSGEPRNQMENQLFEKYKGKMSIWRTSLKSRDDLILDILEFFSSSNEGIPKQLFKEPQNTPNLHSSDKFRGLRQLFEISGPKLFSPQRSGQPENLPF
jgi:hypothetical protein